MLAAVFAVAFAGATIAWRKVRIEEQQPNPTVRRVQGLLADKEYQQAFDALKQLGEPERLTTPELLLLIETNTHLRDYDRVIELCDLMERRRDANPEYHFWKGNAWAGLWRAAKAEAEYKKCISTGVLVSRAGLQLATIYGLQSRRDEAEAILWEIYVQGDPPAANIADSVSAGERVLQPNLLVHLLILKYFGWNADNLLDQLQRFHAADPDDFEAQLAYALGLFRLGRYAESFASVADCVAKRPDHASANTLYLECALTMNKSAELNEWESRHASDFAAAAEIWEQRGEILMNAGKYEQAGNAFQKAVALDPYLHRAHHRLGRCLMRSGKRAAAARHLKLGIALNVITKNLMEQVDVLKESKVYPPENCIKVAEYSHELGRRNVALAWLEFANAQGFDKRKIDELRADIEHYPRGKLVAQLSASSASKGP